MGPVGKSTASPQTPAERYAVPQLLAIQAQAGDLAGCRATLLDMQQVLETDHMYRPSDAEIKELARVLPTVVTLAEAQGDSLFMAILLSFLHLFVKSVDGHWSHTLSTDFSTLSARLTTDLREVSTLAEPRPAERGRRHALNEVTLPTPKTARSIVIDERAFPMDHLKYEARLSLNPNDAPLLAHVPFQIEAPASSTYNCLSHALHLHDRWTWPWDSDVVFIDDFDTLLADKGFAPATQGPPTAADYADPSTYEYLIVYADPAPPHAVNHVIVQRPDGSWSSKSGAYEQIRVASPEALSGDVGVPYKLYRRPR